MQQANLFYCRPGFEADCVLEAGSPTSLEKGEGWGVLAAGACSPARLIFRRQWLSLMAGSLELGGRDRLSPIIDALAALLGAFSDVWLEYPDTNDGKALSGFCKRFEPLLRQRMMNIGLLVDDCRLPRLHLFFPSMGRVYLAMPCAESVPWPQGIARVKMAPDAPSRSTLKLAEAFQSLVPEQEYPQRVKHGMRAVDLGAAPGGWTYQLVIRGMKVTAIDNGPLKGVLAQHPQVEHLKVDGFRYKPKRPVDWLVCDMVEQPHRIARLMAQWLAEGHTRQAIFNLKLPMKKRWQAVQECFMLIHEALSQAQLRYKLDARQLYHDREEITVYLRRA